MANFFKDYSAKYAEKHKNEKIENLFKVANTGSKHPLPDNTIRDKSDKQENKKENKEND